jgi:hypothetical protein
VPVAAAAMTVLTLMIVLTVLPEAGWPIGAGASALVALALAAMGVRPLHVRPLTRRRLVRAEAICALPLIVTTLMSSGLGETLFRSGAGPRLTPPE